MMTSTDVCGLYGRWRVTALCEKFGVDNPLAK
jgi:hypothetical protein